MTLNCLQIYMNGISTCCLKMSLMVTNLIEKIIEKKCGFKGHMNSRV